MKRLRLSDTERGIRVLCLGAHPDDVEIGCGGTLLWLQETVPHVEIHWVVFAAHPPRDDEALTSADRFTQNAADQRVELHSFPDGFLPTEHEAVKREFEILKATSYDVIFTHTADDAHQDHRLVNELTWNTFRDHLILEYEIPKYDGDLGRPSVFVPLDDSILSTKIDILLECFASQRDKDWFTESTFRALARLRGVECRSPWAEAFHCRKITLA